MIRLYKVLSTVFAVILAAGCSNRELRHALSELDQTLENAEVYRSAFSTEVDALAEELSDAQDDSTRWEIADRLYLKYIYYNIDEGSYYVDRMQEYSNGSGLRRQKFLTEAALARIFRSKGNYRRAIQVFESIDTCGMDIPMRNRYYSTGLGLYMFLADQDGSSAVYKTRVAELRRNYFSRDSTSFHSVNMQALWHRDEGRYAKSIQMLGYNLSRAANIHNRSLSEYYMATVYGEMGDVIKQQYWLALSAKDDFMIPVREYGSLYDLAISLYSSGDIVRAGKYIRITLNDAMACNYSERLIRSGRAQIIISDAIYKGERDRRITLIVVVVSLSALLLIIGFLTRRLRKFSRKLKKAYSQLFETNTKLENLNSALEQTNSRLRDVNRIKDNFLSRYMELVAYYIGEVDETKRKLRQTAKKEGVDAMMAMLRAPKYADSEYANFYATFDEVFLRIFPDFADKVNELLPDDRALQLKEDGSLTTELRILAVIRLGITESPKIARILNVSITTVYTYRYRLRHCAICEPEVFEDKISVIGF